MSCSPDAIRVDARGRQHGVPKRCTLSSAADNVWLHVSGLDRFVDVDDTAGLLRAAAASFAAGVLRCEVAGFADAPPYVERRVRDQAKCHQGWALLCFADEASAALAAAGLQGLRLGASRLVAAPSRSRAALSAEKQAAADAKAAAAAAARERQRAHNQRRRLRCRARGNAALEALLQALPLPGGLDAASRFVKLDVLRAASALAPALDWAEVPHAARPSAVLGDGACGPAPAGSTAALQAAREARKRAQVDSFAAVLRHLLAAHTPKGTLTVVDFGCGSGCLLLPLAALCPQCAFVGVDMLEKSVVLLRKRAADAGLSNVTGVVGMIERYDGPCDVALGLHACGNATDFVIAQAQRRGAAFAVCPCCIGKLAFSLAGGSSFSPHMRDLPSLAPSEYRADTAAAAGVTAQSAVPQCSAAMLLPALTHPRSRWMACALRGCAAACDMGGSEAAFAALAAAADVSHGEADADAAAAAGFDEASHGAVARAAKVNIELDRAQGARESGFAVATLKLLQADVTAKNDLLLGAPRAQRPEWASAVDALGAPRAD